MRNAAQALDPQVVGSLELARDVCNVQFKEPDEEEEECHRTPGQRPRAEGGAEASLRRRRRIRQPAPSRSDPTLVTMFPVVLAVL